METLSKEAEEKLCSSIEDAIKLTKEEDLSPDEAIEKVARRDGYGPELINRMVQTFNKTKSMWRLKEANQDERVKPFQIADKDAILSAIYSQSKTASETPKAQAPDSGAWRDKVFQEEATDTEKVASKKVSGESGLSLLNSSSKTMKDSQITPLREADHTRGVFHKMANAAMEKKASANLAVERALAKACETMRTMDPGQMQKVAQHLVNGYPESGPKLVALLSHTMGKEIPAVQKTASHTIFPNKEPYISFGNMYTSAQKQQAAEREIAQLDKEANLLPLARTAGLALTNATARSAANTAKRAVASPGDSALGQAALTNAPHRALANYLNTGLNFSKSPDTLADELSPSRYNRNKEINAKKNFYMSILYDKELKEYDHSDLVGAYNEVVSLVPEAADNPAILRQLMRKHMESAGQLDTFELGQMATLSKTIADARQKRQMTESLKAPSSKTAPTIDKVTPKATEKVKGEKGKKEKEDGKDKDKIKDLQQQLKDREKEYDQSLDDHKKETEDKLKDLHDEVYGRMNAQERGVPQAGADNTQPPLHTGPVLEGGNPGLPQNDDKTKWGDI